MRKLVQNPNHTVSCNQGMPNATGSFSSSEFERVETLVDQNKLCKFKNN